MASIRDAYPNGSWVNPRAPGLLGMLGVNQNPFTSWLGDHSNTLVGLGAGIASGQNFGQGISNGLQLAAQGRAADQDAKKEREATAQAESQKKQTIAMFQKKGYTDLVDAYNAGVPLGSLYQEFVARQMPKASTEPFTLSPGQVRYGPDNKPLASVPAAPDGGNVPAAIQEYQYALSQGFKGSFAEYQTQMKRAGATNLTFNGEQANAATFADRMKAAEPILQATEGVQGDLGQAALGAVPYGLGNFMQKPEYQQAVQAQRDFINAVLRKESGAAISPSEFANAQQQYFPQPGDSQQVIEQKRQNRAIAIAGMERSGGPAYNNPNAPGNGAAAPTDGGVVDYRTYFGGQ